MKEKPIDQTEAQELSKQLSGSGFPLQIALEAAVREGQEIGDSHWKVMLPEAYWKSENASGFIDLVLEGYKYHTSNKLRLIIEVKKLEESRAIFIRDNFSSSDPKKTEFRPYEAKVLLSRSKSRPAFNREKPFEISWQKAKHDLAMAPHSYCVTTTKKDRVIEPLCNQIIESAESFCLQEAEQRSRQDVPQGYCAYCCVLITTGQLFSCSLDPSKIDLSSGVIKRPVRPTKEKWIKFQKSLHSQYRKALELTGQSDADNEEIIVANERTVFVCSSEHFVEFLEGFNILLPGA